MKIAAREITGQAAYRCLTTPTLPRLRGRGKVNNGGLSPVFMSSLAKAGILLLSLAGLGTWGGNANAAEITSTPTGGTWAVGATWVGGVAPAVTDDAVIATTEGNAVTLGADADIVGLTINLSSSLNLSASRIRPTGATSISGTINLGTSPATLFTGLVTINAEGTWTNSDNVVITFRGGLTHNGTTFTAGTGIQTFDTNNQAIGGTSAITGPNVTVTAVTLTNNGSLTVPTALSGTGTLTQGTNATLTIGGTSGIAVLTATANPNTVIYNGAAAQTVKATIYDRLTINNGSGVSLAADTTVNGTLMLTRGVVTTTTVVPTVVYTLITTAACSVSVSRPGGTPGHVAGRLQKNVNAPVPPCIFEVGDEADPTVPAVPAVYRPITANFSILLTLGNLVGTVRAGAHLKHEASFAPPIAVTKRLDRYWTLAAPVSGAIASGAYSVTLEFDAVDFFGVADCSRLVVARYSAGWFINPPATAPPQLRRAALFDRGQGFAAMAVR